MQANSEIVESILNNPSAHIVNRAEKMGRTLDKMCVNHVIKQSQVTNEARAIDESKGYGKGRNQGD